MGVGVKGSDHMGCLWVWGDRGSTEILISEMVKFGRRSIRTGDLTSYQTRAKSATVANIITQNNTFICIFLNGPNSGVYVDEQKRVAFYI